MKSNGFGRSRVAFAMTYLLGTANVSASIIINELDYDQPGSDTGEFIELYNTGNNAISLDGYHIDLFNGNNGAIYRTIELDNHSIAANAYFVICGNDSTVLNCNYSVTSSSSWLQNGAPDGVALYNGLTLFDSLSYEGWMRGLTEGNELAIADSNSLIMSLARLPNGSDSNDNLTDFAEGCITPGSANIPGTGNCSSLVASPVPVPAAAWLLASGLIGLGFTARPKQQCNV